MSITTYKTLNNQVLSPYCHLKTKPPSSSPSSSVDLKPSSSTSSVDLKQSSSLLYITAVVPIDIMSMVAPGSFFRNLHLRDSSDCNTLLD